jgi:hypothetical protein
LVGIDTQGNIVTDFTSNPLLNALYYVGPSESEVSNATTQAGFTSDISQAPNPIIASGSAQVGQTFTGNGTGTSGTTGGPVSGSGTTTPEPASMAVLGIGIIGLIGYSYRRRQSLPATAC